MSTTLSGAAVRIAALALTRDRAASHQCFRIKNLDANEVVQVVKAWPAVAREARLEAVRLLIAESLGGAVPAEYVAAEGKSITFYRNHNPEGLVYVEVSAQSDEQGLQNIFSLRDINFLDGSFDDYAKANRGVPGLLVEEAWRHCGGSGTVPQLLLERLLLVIGLVHPEIEPVPIRRFVEFIELACGQWIRHPRTIDATSGDQIIGRALWAMDMFPDERWNDAGSETRRRRRLETNARHADLLEGSTELDGEEVVARARATRFKDTAGNPMPAPEARRWVGLCSEYGLTPTPELRRQIPYEIFGQLFLKDTAGLRLGDRVRAEMEDSAPERLREFDALDVTVGLNSRSSRDANRLLEAVPPAGLSSLADCTSAATRKSIERLASPPRRRFFNPAIEIVRLLQRVRLEQRSSTVASIEIAIGNDEGRGSPMHGLFAFLFGDTLRSIASGLDGLPGACQLRPANDLITPQTLPELRHDRDAEDDETAELAWDALALRFTLRDAEGKVLEEVDQMEWRPPAAEQFALFWILATAADSPALRVPGTLRISPPSDGSDWQTALVLREASLDAFALERLHEMDVGHPLLAELTVLRAGLRENLDEMGLEVARLQGFLDEWQTLLHRARIEFVPDGVRSRALDAFLGTDLVVVGSAERRLMLPVHPIRLRWICGYLEQTRKLAEEILSGEASFSDGEGAVYLDWLENLTPRESPPIAVGGAGQLLYSRSELGWWEDFSPLSTAASDVSFDAGSISSITKHIVSYLDSHPYKRDGLSLLVVLPPTDTMPAEILSRIPVKASRPLRVTLHVAAPKHRWEAIARSVESLSEAADNAPRERLFPDRDLALIEYSAGGTLSEALHDLQIDIAVVPHVLQEQVISQQNTEAPMERPGTFDPLQHRPIRLESGGGGGSISLVMLPKYPDPVLESWSTLVVRAHRSRPVSPGQPENTDLVELRINFQDSARLFRELHDHCHWVITLERYISREQIESVEAGAPDVLSVEQGVGSNGLHTLVVSSRSGRDLILSRLVRKLHRLIPPRCRPAESPHLLSELAHGIYDSTRRLAPKLTLQALGVARVTEEIVGLTIARNLAEAVCPAQLSSGFVAWISLDEHTEWFGGPAQVRADMCRLTFHRVDDHVIDLDVLVLEGKLRQLYDGHGVVQVQQTIDFFSSVLDSDGSTGVRRVDATMWREQIASAIESLAPEAVQLVGTDRGSDRSADEEFVHRMLSDFRSGTARLRNVKGVYSACLWDGDGEHLEQSEVNGITVLRSTRFHLVDYLRRRTVRSSVEIGEYDVTPVPHPSGLSANVATTGVMVDLNAAVDAAAAPSEELHKPPHDEPGPDLPTQGNAQQAQPIATAPPVRPARGVGRDVLRRIYEDILGCFGMHGIPVTAANDSDEPIVEGPASILFKVRPGPGIDPKKLSEKGAALKLVLQLEQEQNVTFNIDRGFVTVDVPKRAEQRYYVDAADTWDRWQRPRTELAIPIGEDRFGELVELNFSSPNSPHLLVAGTTGSGKSEALNTILFGLTRHYGAHEIRLLLVDPKGTELLPFEGSPYLEGSIGWDDQDAVVLLGTAVEEMQRRYQLFKSAGKRSLAEYNAAAGEDGRLPWWLVVLDEYADLTHDPQSKKDIEAELKRLAQKARAAGIHVIIATQKPSAEVISTNLRSNLPAQLALRVKSSIESRVVMDEAGAENLNGKGDGLLKADGRIRRVQCSRVSRAAAELALQGPSPLSRAAVIP